MKPLHRAIGRWQGNTDYWRLSVEVKPSSIRQVFADVPWTSLQFRVSLAEKATASHQSVEQVTYGNSLAPNFTDRQGRANLASDGRLKRGFHDE
ncbi:MAG: hypothetical protein NTW34_02370 [Actinobacteria bacterium]|nr:hypothetical protein [Actinomycetota bacterium]